MHERIELNGLKSSTCAFNEPTRFNDLDQLQKGIVLQIQWRLVPKISKIREKEINIRLTDDFPSFVVVVRVKHINKRTEKIQVVKDVIIPQFEGV